MLLGKSRPILVCSLLFLVSCSSGKFGFGGRADSKLKKNSEPVTAIDDSTWQEVAQENFLSQSADKWGCVK